VLFTYLLDAPSLSSRTVRVNGVRPVAHPDGTCEAFTSEVFVPARANIPTAGTKGDGSNRDGEVLVPAGAVLFAVVACEPE
jgi:hypothetical protein